MLVDRSSVDPTALRRRSPMTPLTLLIVQRIARAAVYVWAFPTTAVGLLFLPLVLVSREGGARVVDGVLELYGGPVAFFLRKCTLLKGGASAMTLGHVVLGRTEDLL